MKACCSFSMLIGRVLLSIIFILAGVGKLMDFHGTAAYMTSKGMTMVPLFLYAAAVVEILGGLSLLLGFKTRVGAALLILFLVPTTAIFHDFWNYADPMEQNLQMINFLKNLAIGGGLFYVLGCGSGGCSVDGVCCGKSCKVEEKGT